MPRPKDKSGVRTLLGVMTYLGKFCPHLFDVSEPLRDLTKEEAIFKWASLHEETLQRLKKLITESPVL